MFQPVVAFFAFNPLKNFPRRTARSALRFRDSNYCIPAFTRQPTNICSQSNTTLPIDHQPPPFYSTTHSSAHAGHAIQLSFFCFLPLSGTRVNQGIAFDPVPHRTVIPPPYLPQLQISNITRRLYRKSSLSRDTSRKEVPTQETGPTSPASQYIVILSGQGSEQQLPL